MMYVNATRAPGGEDDQFQPGQAVQIADKMYTVREARDGEGGTRVLRPEEWSGQ